MNRFKYIDGWTKPLPKYYWGQKLKMKYEYSTLIGFASHIEIHGRYEDNIWLVKDLSSISQPGPFDPITEEEIEKYYE